MSAKLENIKVRIAEAAQKAGRNPARIKLLAVSKRKPPEMIEELYSMGQTSFAENYLQEAQGKIATINGDIQWHFIGHIQSKKTAQIAELFDVVHTVDRVKIANGLEKKLAQLDKKLTVYVQVNIGREPQKSGVEPEELTALVSAVISLPHLRFAGLMAMPPYSQNPETSRPYFREMRHLCEELRQNIDGLPRALGLSMGMSGDFETAIAEGATVVRVGTALFGDRG